ncbi:SpoIIE family protein phosphatase [Streptomyces sp. XD-27]|uniref:SpoIIE family protein phosphatase n=1 Tax=Streptomyces sp. XD-27 TaxID=3062779 RepID=UPI0026F42EC6|nr:SpoIIE family protein phosphatase [Streptomyces sp. XD-27]WKX72320.1 SpoIIE family protein phosphatase [Streptomyces sp. XD-27]
MPDAAAGPSGPSGRDAEAAAAITGAKGTPDAAGEHGAGAGAPDGHHAGGHGGAADHTSEERRAGAVSPRTGDESGAARRPGGTVCEACGGARAAGGAGPRPEGHDGREGRSRPEGDEGLHGREEHGAHADTATHGDPRAGADTAPGQPEGSPTMPPPGGGGMPTPRSGADTAPGGPDSSRTVPPSGGGMPAQRGTTPGGPDDASTSTMPLAQDGGVPAPRGTAPGRPHGSPAAPPPGGGAVPVPRDRGGDRLRFVGAATRRIARGIDLDEIVLGLCRATVPTFADAILVYLRDPLPVGDERPVGPVVLRLRRTDRIPEEPDTDGVRLPLLPAQPDLSPVMAGGPANELCEVEPGGPLAEVLRGVRPVFGDSPAARDALPELLGDGRTVATGQRTVLAPLRGRRRVIGAAIFVRRPDRPPFEPDDLLVAAQLATHTALGVDKAVLYGREVYIADELQRTMLPDSLPQPTGVRLASRYLPAAETARVGGDWYDAIPLPGNRVALVVGDVMGHSMTSAAIMGQLRTTAQTLAGLDLPPQEVLHHLDEQAQRLGTDRMATCLYAVYDPVAHRIVVANAGHPPPVLLHRGGRAEVLRVPPGAPIGVGGVDFEAVELDAPAGATLLLYTDGLVESRMRDVWTGIEQLRERLTATARLTGPNPPPLEPLCDEVLDMLGPGDRDDDVALLAARFEGIAPSDVAYWYLDPKAQTAGQARRLARRALDRWGLSELTDSVELLVSEVVTNAVRYAERPITLRLLRTDVLRCEVGDDVPQLPRLRQARPSDEGGRGLYLVNRLARRWGATRLSTGKVVWFELGMPSVS